MSDLIYRVLLSEGASHLDALNIASRIEEALADAGFEISAKGLKLKSGRVLTLEDIERLAAEAEAGHDMENAVPVSVMVPLGRSEPELDNTCSACGKRLVDCECDFKAGHLTKSEP